MANLSALATLIGLAQTATDNAAKKLGAELTAVEEAQQKLTMLHGYRDDYAAKLEAAQMNGITPLDHSHAQRCAHRRRSGRL